MAKGKLQGLGEVIWNRERDTDEKKYGMRERERIKKNVLPDLIAALNPAPEEGFSNERWGLDLFPHVLVVVVVAQAVDVAGLGTSGR